MRRSCTSPTAIVPPMERTSNLQARTRCWRKMGTIAEVVKEKEGKIELRSCGNGNGGADDTQGERRWWHTMQVTVCAPYRSCLVSFVPGVSSAFFPVTARQLRAVAVRCGTVRLVSSCFGLVSHWNCSNGNECVILTTYACHSAALVFSLSLSLTCSVLFLSFTFPFFFYSQLNVMFKFYK